MALKNKRVRKNVQQWGLIAALTLWSGLATFQALYADDKLVLIAIEDSGTRLILEPHDPALQNEFKNFVSQFLNHYFTYDDRSFASQIDFASRLMNSEFWEQQRPRLLDLKSKFEVQSIVQKAEIESIDLLTPDHVEARLQVFLKTASIEEEFHIKIRLGFQKIQRSKANPWGYEVTEVSNVKF